VGRIEETFIDINFNCAIEVTEGWPAPAPDCVEWSDVTTDTIGWCGPFI